MFFPHTNYSCLILLRIPAPFMSLLRKSSKRKSSSRLRRSLRKSRCFAKFLLFLIIAAAEGIRANLCWQGDRHCHWTSGDNRNSLWLWNCDGICGSILISQACHLQPGYSTTEYSTTEYTTDYGGGYGDYSSGGAAGGYGDGGGYGEYSAGGDYGAYPEFGGAEVVSVSRTVETVEYPDVSYSNSYSTGALVCCEQRGVDLPHFFSRIWKNGFPPTEYEWCLCTNTYECMNAFMHVYGCIPSKTWTS